MDLQSPHGPPRLSLHTRITDLPVEDTCRSTLVSPLVLHKFEL
ncbi:hypothetical protein OROMI_010556 [Orobanche minor]